MLYKYIQVISDSYDIHEFVRHTPILFVFIISVFEHEMYIRNYVIVYFAPVMNSQILICVAVFCLKWHKCHEPYK